MYYRTLMLTVIAKVMLKWKRVQFFLTHMYTLIVLVATHYVLYIRRHFACRVVNTWNVSRLIVLTSAH